MCLQITVNACRFLSRHFGIISYAIGEHQVQEELGNRCCRRDWECDRSIAPCEDIKQPHQGYQPLEESFVVYPGAHRHHHHCQYPAFTLLKLPPAPAHQHHFPHRDHCLLQYTPAQAVSQILTGEYEGLARRAAVPIGNTH